MRPIPVDPRASLEDIHFHRVRPFLTGLSLAVQELGGVDYVTFGPPPPSASASISLPWPLMPAQSSTAQPVSQTRQDMSVVLVTGSYDHEIRFWEAWSGICSRTITRTGESGVGISNTVFFTSLTHYALYS